LALSTQQATFGLGDLISAARGRLANSAMVGSKQPSDALKSDAPIGGLVHTRILAVAFACLPLLFASSSYADIDRSAVDFQVPADIKWVRNAAGTNEQAILFGDPSQPGPYVVRLRWLPGNMSRPHFHRNDRHFIVISGTWWLGTGENYDPDSTVPAPAGSYVIHYAGKVHYDGAKDEETVIQVWGMGPATSFPAEQR
jgi:quercetin dioxygenase-like cupin family protein